MSPLATSICTGMTTAGALHPPTDAQSSAIVAASEGAAPSAELGDEPRMEFEDDEPTIEG